MDVRGKVQEIFRDIFNNENLEIADSTCADDIEDWDSLMQINLIVAMEKEFGIKFGFNELSGLQNVGDMINLIERKL